MPSAMEVTLRPAEASDAAAITDIYNPFIANTCITFEVEPILPQEMARRITETQAARLPWLVAEVEGKVIGYAYASSWKGRCAYGGSVEATIYLDPSVTGKGVGRRLYSALIDELRQRPLHTVVGGIALPNAASIALHEALGFEKVAQFREIGYKQDRWIDVGYWQLLLG